MRHLLLMLPLACLALPVLADDDRQAVDQCIAAWGKESPFRKGTKPDAIIATSVKVFGVGSSQSGDDPVSERPRLILVRPAVNVMGKSTIRLHNPKGWYCVRSAVTVAGKLEIDAHCKAHIASAREGGGTAVGAADDSNKGVAVFGALRVSRFGCS